ncbi:MAG: hypothetical protein DMD99_14170 [Candidatus Rokuibacteriota bacterium]|nr:MAG: hypothetical protein DMD99_14170 [Candidatus Rokubacteria bacterium]
MPEEQMPAGHRHQLEEHRLGDALGPLRSAEDVVTRVEALRHLDPGSAVEGERHDLVDETIAHRGLNSRSAGPERR